MKDVFLKGTRIIIIPTHWRHPQTAPKWAPWICKVLALCQADYLLPRTLQWITGTCKKLLHLPKMYQQLQEACKPTTWSENTPQPMKQTCHWLVSLSKFYIFTGCGLLISFPSNMRATQEDSQPCQKPQLSYLPSAWIAWHPCLWQWPIFCHK